MKCRAWVVEKPGRKKGNGERYTKIVAVRDAYVRTETQYLYEDTKNKTKLTGIGKPKRVVFYPTPPETHPDATLCGGKIIVEVKAVDEPYYGGTSATFEIEYKCERCKWTFHGADLPTTQEEVSKLLTDYIEQLPDVTA
jgi:hypothetical protein